MRIAPAATALLLATALGGCAADDPDAAPADPTRAPAAQSETQNENGTDDCRLLGAREETLDPGCWAIRATGADDVRAELTVPEDGFFGSYSWVFNNPEREERWGAITFELAGGVYPNPCRSGHTPSEQPETVDAFVRDLAAQPVTRTTKPVAVTLGGYSGLYTEITTPPQYDISRCHDDELHLWQLPAEPTTLWAGHVRRLWALDVDGRPLVLTLATTTDSTRATVEKFTGLLTSVELRAS